MAKNTRKRPYDPAINSILKKLTKRYGPNTVRRWHYDEELGWVMPRDDYVRTYGTDRGYRAFIRVDEAQLFVQLLPTLPRLACARCVDAQFQND